MSPCTIRKTIYVWLIIYYVCTRIFDVTSLIVVSWPHDITTKFRKLYNPFVLAIYIVKTLLCSRQGNIVALYDTLANWSPQHQIDDNTSRWTIWNKFVAYWYQKAFCFPNKYKTELYNMQTIHRHLWYYYHMVSLF